MKAIPELYALGPYAPEVRQGPVIWLKCIIERSLPDASPPPGVVPILYLPNVSRQDLRAGGDCPTDLQPLIELQYRGAVWHQRNGRDWTVDAFLSSEDGVGLEIAKDNRTRDALLRALALLAPEPLVALRGHRLEADDFDRLAIGDPVRDLLGWMSDSEAFEARCDPNRWATFKDICWREFSFDPDEDGTQGAANALLQGGGKWDEVWRRFCDAPRLYQGVSAVLRQARPRDLLGLADHSRRPGLNEEQEDRLRKELEGILALPHAQACEKVDKLDNEHRERRGWVWAQLGESPYAVALEPLGRLAKAAKTALGGATAQAMAADYASQGWRCDRAAMEALCRLKQGTENGLVTKVVRALYEPWLDRSARRFQELMSAPGVDPHKLTAAVAAERDTCVLFADGLRFDVGAILQERLEAQGFRVRMSHRIAPIPTVTATAKPVASPAHGACSGKADAEEFAPIITSSNQPANASRLRDVMARAGVEILDQDQSKMAVSGEGGGWTETGKLDALGHSLECSPCSPDRSRDRLPPRSRQQPVERRMEQGPCRHGSWMAPSPRRPAEGRAIAASGRHQMGAVRRREGRLDAEHPDLPVVLEPRAAHRFAAGHRCVHGEHGIRSRRHQPSGMRHSRTHRRTRRGGRGCDDHRDQLARYEVQGRGESPALPACKSTCASTGNRRHPASSRLPRNSERTAKRASPSQTTNTKARRPRLSSPTRRDGCSIPSRPPSEKTHEH